MVVLNQREGAEECKCTTVSAKEVSYEVTIFFLTSKVSYRFAERLMASWIACETRLLKQGSLSRPVDLTGKVKDSLP
jgi:hypothetical protein